MKPLIPFLMFFALAAGCSEKSGSGDADSAQAQPQAAKPMSKDDSLAFLLSQHSKDTTHMYALPPVFEGDIVFQNDSGAQGKAVKEISPNGRFNHCGMIFIRERDHQYMVIEAHDSVTTTPLQAWVDRGMGDHVAIYRMKDANTTMTRERTMKLRASSRRYKRLPYDNSLSWGDDAMYAAELVWKLYHDGTGYRICEPTTLDSIPLTGAITKRNLAKAYGKNIPKTEQVVTPERLMTSPLFEKVYEQ